MFQIKICGVTSVKDAQLAALAGADAIGLNFFAKSSRCIDLGMAESVVAKLLKPVTKVGVFVNAPSQEIQLIAQQLQLDYVQLHGDEPPEFLAELSDLPIIRAFRCGEDGFSDVHEYLDKCAAMRLPDAVLIDAYRAGEYGGTGEVVDWERLAENAAAFGDIPFILAGGLTPFNVEEAIAKTRPSSVDTASGVEAAVGNKDPMLVRAFVNAAKKGFSRLNS